MKKFLVLSILMIQALVGFAQTDRQYIRYGNRWFKQDNYVKAEAEYRKAVDKNPSNPQALYNLGCALLMQKKDSAAIQQFEHAGKIETDPKRKAMAYHNIGWICQSLKMYGEAAEAYKESLRNNPSDNETRYNLALCMRQQKKNKQDKDKQQQKKQQNKGENKSKEKKEQDKNQKQQQQKQQEKMSKENAEQMLNAAMQQEQQTQQRIKDAMRQNRSRKLQKNW
ncbi:tetratricopeptide repeat protein [Leyella stercorea]|mgnify:FL=1|jgi:tetratricopeptide (TPR) repeat protein|uniref:tetratricopeptide repeat protein n=1 Tax=Leyella stercorea TaxID=363265 RepID=UPI00248AE9E5|nr:tetratricopeptide repeat protein [Leyella stercorea]